MKQQIKNILEKNKFSKIMVVSKSSFSRLGIDEMLDELGVKYVLFDGYNPNPDYEDIVVGVEQFRSEKCDSLMAIGGGSTIDVAKCIKAYANMDCDRDYMEQEISDSGIPFIAIPTTAGSGSEVTPNAVIYREKVKQSVAAPFLRPTDIILDGRVLNSLSDYQKKCTVLDALAQAIEAWWSLKSTEESRKYSKQAVELIVNNISAYVAGDNSVNQTIMEGSNLAGKAIAIAGTTVPHAMSYRLTGLYKIAHGHGVALALPKVWKRMWDNLEKCVDSRGADYVREVFNQIAVALGTDSVLQAIELLESMLADMEILPPTSQKLTEDLSNLTASVPESKILTNPVKTEASDVRGIYSEIVNGRNMSIYSWAYRLCQCAGEDEQYFQRFWDKLNKSEKVTEEFVFYMEHEQFLGKYSVAGMTLIDIMIWQMDHFKSDLDRGLYDMQSNPDTMVLKAFETMLDMENEPEGYVSRYLGDTGTDYPGKY